MTAATERARPTVTIVWSRPEPAPDAAHPLTRARLAATVLALADTEGLAALTPERVAAQVGGAAELARHVEAAPDLVDLLVDEALGEVRLPERPDGWRTGLTTLASGIRDMLRRHPYIAAVVQTRPLLGPNALRCIEFAFAAFDGLDLPPGTVDAYTGLVIGYVYGSGALEWSELEAQREWVGEWTEHDFHDLLAPCFAHAVGCGRYPSYARFLRAGAPHPDPEERFALGLSCLLDGLAARLPG